MKKIFTLISISIICLALIACGADNAAKNEDSEKEIAETEKTVETDAEIVEERIIPGTYETASLFIESTYVLNENTSYDKTNPAGKGVYSVSDEGIITLSAQGSGDTVDFKPHKNYYYRISGKCCFEKDDAYGLAPTFDENGRTNQQFQASYERTNDGSDLFVLIALKEDGSFILKNNKHKFDGRYVTVVPRSIFEGTYVLNDDILMLQYGDIEVPMIFVDGKLYFDVIEKRTEETEQKLDAIQVAVKAAKEAKFAPVDSALSDEISAKFQGGWEYTSNNANYEVLVDGYDITVTSSIVGYTISNKGTYTVCKDFFLITYETGLKAIMQYEYNNGSLEIYPVTGLDE